MCQQHPKLKIQKISKSLQDDDFGSILDTMRYCKKAFMMMNVSFDLTYIWVIQKFYYFSDENEFLHLLVFVNILYHDY